MIVNESADWGKENEINISPDNIEVGGRSSNILSGDLIKHKHVLKRVTRQYAKCPTFQHTWLLFELLKLQCFLENI